MIASMMFVVLKHFWQQMEWEFNQRKWIDSHNQYWAPMIILKNQSLKIINSRYSSTLFCFSFVTFFFLNLTLSVRPFVRHKLCVLVPSFPPSFSSWGTNYKSGFVCPVVCCKFCVLVPMFVYKSKVFVVVPRFSLFWYIRVSVPHLLRT